MDTGHLHLMLNHVPVLGAPVLALLLAYGLGRRLPEVTRIALWGTAALGLVTLVVYLTGEAAEEMVERLPTFDHDMVERHEAIALGVTAVLVATAVGAAVALWSAPRGGRLSQTVTRVVLVGLLAGSVLAAATAWTGGPIGHPEIRPVATR